MIRDIVRVKLKNRKDRKITEQKFQASEKLMYHWSHEIEPTDRESGHGSLAVGGRVVTQSTLPRLTREQQRYWDVFSGQALTPTRLEREPLVETVTRETQPPVSKEAGRWKKPETKLPGR